MKTYAIYRHYFKGEKRLIKEGLTLEEAKAHCDDPETSSSTATNPDEPGDWFDGWTEE